MFLTRYPRDEKLRIIEFDSSHNFDVYRFLTLNLVPKVCLFLVLILDFHEHTTMMNHRP